jgi:hypothetical protein
MQAGVTSLWPIAIGSQNREDLRERSGNILTMINAVSGNAQRKCAQRDTPH